MPAPERPAAGWANLAVRQERSPVGELFNVLQHDHAWADGLRPAGEQPGQAAAAPRLVAVPERLAAASLRVERTVGREPTEADPPAADEFGRIYVPNAPAEVLGAGMVYPVHLDRFGIMIDRLVDWAPEGLLDAFARASAAGKVVDGDLVEAAQDAARWPGKGVQNGEADLSRLRYLGTRFLGEYWTVSSGTFPDESTGLRARKRRHGMEEVVGSIPTGSATIPRV
jgi:hypothetical protein